MKPKCKAIGQDSNIFNVLALAKRSLKNAGMHAEAKEMIEKVVKATSYYEALNIITDYVEIV